MYDFYDEFLGSDPEIAKKFELTNFSRQVQVLEEAILMMIYFARNPKLAGKDLVHLSDRHSINDLNIPDHHYDIWLDCFLKTVKKTDPEWSEELEDLWRNALELGIDYFKSNRG